GQGGCTTRTGTVWSRVACALVLGLTLHPGPVAAQGQAAPVAPGQAPAAPQVQSPLRWSRNVPGDSRPIILYADDIATWTEQGRRIFLLKGKVLVEQGVVHLHMPQGVVWVDEDHKRRTGIHLLRVYAEGDVRLEEGPKNLTD